MKLKCILESRDLKGIVKKFTINGRCGKNECSIQSRLLSSHLSKLGIKNHVVHGAYERSSGSYNPHVWVVVGDKILDPTVGQFNSDKNITSIDDKKYIKNFFKKTIY